MRQTDLSFHDIVDVLNGLEEPMYPECLYANELGEFFREGHESAEEALCGVIKNHSNTGVKAICFCYLETADQDSLQPQTKAMLQEMHEAFQVVQNATEIMYEN